MGNGVYLVFGLVTFNICFCIAAILLRVYFKLSLLGPDNCDEYTEDNVRIQ